MRSTILPCVIILAMACRVGRGQYYGQEVLLGLSTASETEVFLNFYYPTIFMNHSCLCNYKAKISYCNRNTPNPHYSPLFTSGG